LMLIIYYILFLLSVPKCLQLPVNKTKEKNETRVRAQVYWLLTLS
jgi:hypothetical protein